MKLKTFLIGLVLFLSFIVIPFWIIIPYLLVLLGKYLNLLVLEFYLGMNFYVTKHEEPNLKKKFGEEYINYTKKVPRWL